MAHGGPPQWLAPKAGAAIRRAFVLAVLDGRDGLEAARSVAWAWHPALPATMIAEAVLALMEAQCDQA